MPSLTGIDAQRSIDETISEHEERISELEERILQLKTAVLALRTRRNTHSAISKLPPELIANIFLHAKSYAPRSTYNRRPGWLNVSPVCRHWRAIVLDTPRLWQVIDLSWDVQNALEILKRSKGMPLQVCRPYSYHTVNFEAVAIAVMCNIERIHELDVVVSRQDSISLQEFLELNPSGSAPALEVLKLGSSFEYTLPRGVFWQDLPALRVLKLRDISVNELPMLPRLSRLILHGESAISSCCLLQALLNTPLIEEISVFGLLADLDTEMPLRVSLPKLTSLRIHTYYVVSSKLFDYIDYPCSAIVDFSVSAESLFPDISCLQSICLASGDAPTLSDSIEISLHLVTFAVNVSPAGSDAESPARPRLRISVPSSRPVPAYVRVCRTLPLATAHTLSLSLTLRESNAEWSTLFPLCPQLTTLCLSGWGTEVLVGLLSTSDNPKPPCEMLETIIVSHCKFDEQTGTADVMVRLLEERQELGIAIRELRLEQCEISRDLIDVFEDLVEVHTDGWESRVKRNFHPVLDEESDYDPEDSAEEVSNE